MKMFVLKTVLTIILGLFSYATIDSLVKESFKSGCAYMHVKNYNSKIGGSLMKSVSDIKQECEQEYKKR